MSSSTSYIFQKQYKSKRLRHLSPKRCKSKSVAQKTTYYMFYKSVYNLFHKPSKFVAVDGTECIYCTG